VGFGVGWLVFGGGEGSEGMLVQAAGREGDQVNDLYGLLQARVDR
jgi:hypothetical protein